MTAPNALRTLASLIETVDDAELSVDGVETPGTALVEDRTLAANLAMQIELEPLDGVDESVSVSLSDGTPIESDGTTVEIPLTVEIDAPADRTVADRPADAAQRQVTDGGVAVAAGSSDESAVTDRAAEPERNETREVDDPRRGETDDPDQSETAASDGDSTPSEADDSSSATAAEPHRDPERLREVYEAHETFPEMTEALDADVTPQTVRRHMIKHGIHEPRPQGDSESSGDGDSSVGEASGATDEPDSDATDASSESPSSDGENGTDAAEPTDSQTECDDEPGGESRPSEDVDCGQDGVTEADLPADLELPSHVAIEDLRRAVADSTTLYEVQRELRIDRSTARKVLRELDLLDLVTGRVATADEGTADATTVDERLRRACS